MDEEEEDDEEGEEEERDAECWKRVRCKSRGEAGERTERGC